MSLFEISSTSSNAQKSFGGWTEAKDIQKRYSLMNSHDKKVTVALVEVEGTHSYFAAEQSVWVHNYDWN